MLEAKLNNPENGIQGYVELKDWIEKNKVKLSITIHYSTIALETLNQV
jgi:hypothetical protein